MKVSAQNELNVGFSPGRAMSVDELHRLEYGWYYNFLILIETIIVWGLERGC